MKGETGGKVHSNWISRALLLQGRAGTRMFILWIILIFAVTSVLVVVYGLFSPSAKVSNLGTFQLRGGSGNTRVSSLGQVLAPIPYGGDLTVSDKVVKEAVREAFGPDVRGDVLRIHRDVGGGVINAVFRVDLGSGERVWVKFGSPFWDGCGKLHANAAVLRYLRSHTSLPVPEPLAVLDRISGVRTEVLVLSDMPGRKLADELLRPTSEVPKESRQAYFEAWANVFVQLKRLKFRAFGSFTVDAVAPPSSGRTDESYSDLEVGPLLSNGGCSGLGPFENYAGYAAARVQMFLPLVSVGACNSQFTPLLGRMECLVLAIQDYQPPEQHADKDALQAVILHSDLSARNLLVSGGAVGDNDGPARVTAVLDWEFAVAGLAEEEITFPATFESHATDADSDDIRTVFEKAGIVAPKGASTRSDHVSAYWQLIVACHSGAWKDDPSFDDAARERAVAQAKTVMESILRRHSC